jgi:hypothetical protein
LLLLKCALNVFSHSTLGSIAGLISARLEGVFRVKSMDNLSRDEKWLIHILCFADEAELTPIPLKCTVLVMKTSSELVLLLLKFIKAISFLTDQTDRVRPNAPAGKFRIHSRDEIKRTLAKQLVGIDAHCDANNITETADLWNILDCIAMIVEHIDEPAFISLLFKEAATLKSELRAGSFTNIFVPADRTWRHPLLWADCQTAVQGGWDGRDYLHLSHLHFPGADALHRRYFRGPWDAVPFA